MHTRPSVRTFVIRRGAAAVIGLAATAALVTAGGSASAAPSPTIPQVQARITKLDNQAAKLGQQYDQVKQDLAAARQRLKLLNRQAARYKARYAALRAEVGRIAATAFEQGSLTSSTALLTSGNPQQILNQSSMLGELSSTNKTEIHQYTAAGRQLHGAQLAAKRTEKGIEQLKASLTTRQNKLNGLIATQKTLLAQLTPAQRQQVAPGGGGGGGTGGTTPTKSPVPVSGQAGAAVAYAYAHLGDAYVYGAAGPTTFDCSGLMMAAWASAGVSIPRTSYEQEGSLPQVPLNDLQPGDILGFAGNSHVGMYVGGGYLIDAPVPGGVVEKVALSGWYRSELDGAVRP